MNLFENYVSKFDMDNLKIKGRYEHTFRVQRLCELIADDMGMSDEDITIASLCGLYHDIGRFPQITIYNSYSDYKTGYDHGDEGAKIFKKELASKINLSSNDKSLLENCIKYHNKLSVDELSGKDLLFCNILRDADRIDILYEMTCGVIPIIPTGEITKECHDDFINKRLVNKKNQKSRKDGLLVCLAFIWDLNFESSKKILKETKYYEQIEKLINDDSFNIYFEMIKKELNKEE